jgi:hypothetical protein
MKPSLRNSSWNGQPLWLWIFPRSVIRANQFGHYPWPLNFWGFFYSHLDYRGREIADIGVRGKGRGMHQAHLSHQTGEGASPSCITIPTLYGIVHKQFWFAPLRVSHGNIRRKVTLYGKQPLCRSWGWISYYGPIAFSWNWTGDLVIAT